MSYRPEKNEDHKHNSNRTAVRGTADHVLLAVASSVPFCLALLLPVRAFKSAVVEANHEIQDDCSTAGQRQVGCSFPSAEPVSDNSNHCG